MNMVALYNMVHKYKEKWKLASVGPVGLIAVPGPWFGKICVKLKPQRFVPDPDPYRYVFLDLQDPDPELYVRIRIRILPSTSKIIKKNLISKKTKIKKLFFC